MENSEQFVTIPLEEYNKLVVARSGIDLIGQSIGRYGADRTIVCAVCKTFGYEYKEETEDA